MPQQKRALAVTEALQRDREDNLTLILDWSMYHIDNHVRRAKPLQEWSEENYPVVIRINSQIANQHDIQSGEMVAIVQDEAILNLPVQIDDSIAGSYVIIPAGIQETAGFGENMGPVRLLRGLSK
jgi:anaerobic selenocysteine-containing dehydrogenase